MEHAIRLEGITKVFGSVAANDGVNLDLRFGEVLALLGENGSGKTTLMNMLSGIYHPDGGEIHIRGRQVKIASPSDAKKLGIGMVHQHFKLVESFTAFENITLGAKARRKSLAEDKVRELCGEYGLSVPLGRKIRDMSVGEKQTAEILKLLYCGADILILDEPTAVLTPQEAELLFVMLRKMRENGCAVIIITHKLSEVLSISDRVTVLRRGKSVATVETSETDAKALTELMVGRPVDLSIKRPEPQRSESPLLEVRELCVKNTEGAYALKNLSFSLSGGEILGVAGVAGGGQKELCEAISGLMAVEGGDIVFDGTSILGQSPAEIIRKGISMSFIPEDRLGMGLVASMDITHNMLLKTYRDEKSPVLHTAPAREMARKIVKQLDVSTPGLNVPVRQLSGGNVQKVLLGREMESKPRLLITAYPVRGLDTNASFTIYDLLNEAKREGEGILFIGEDLDVLLELCDRIMVLCHGECMGIADAETVTKEQLGLLMTGQKPEAEERA
ncbi:ABC transporter [Clostridia bacterium]|nr:ABC transporter [Clostridia bacterium]